ncbi:hypothetical protein FDP41_008700 [Naegleria fowleri]|uniref:Cullin family profile domain-containing protein n=1 Tax=Naegleria fowleri TaxID=5763 RepID=A0A6A5BEM4_NAEFO|nr:uncharacterized protein FDP41_008700 [Naegleria fowleri]KAF0973036.1 hypothetical protein FDP41_008700 [Naegleria fowleri]
MSGTNKAPLGGSGKLVIPGYIQRKGQMGKSDVDDKLEKIISAIDQIYQENASSLSFQVLYTSGYQIVLHKNGDALYEGVRSKLSQYIQGVREKIMECTDEGFLKELLRQWEKHRTSVSMVRDILMYMDRNYVKQYKKTPVYELGIKLFGQEVFHKNTLERIQRLIMDIIYKDRCGEVVADRFLMKSLTQMMIEISKKDIYETHFEKKFLDESRQFYTKEANDYFESSTATDYLKKVTQRLKEERDRVDRCMDPDTKPKIETVLKNVMIDKFKHRIIEKEGSGCIVMLQTWRVDDLRLVFDVLSLVEGALDPCVDLVENFCRSEGYHIVKDKEKEENPVDFIADLIVLKEKYEDLLVRAFSIKKGKNVMRDSKFQTCVKKAFDDVINANERFPEYLSLYVDSKLKKGKTQINESEFDVLFEQVIALFRHLREKDIFEKYYKTHLAKRLLNQRSQSDDAEKAFIAKLKQEFGYQFTTKLEGMFTDMRLSRETNESFKNYIERYSNKKPPVDLSVQVLTTGYWPVTQSIAVTVPELVDKAANIFKEFYTNEHTGRKLTWQFNMGTCDVKANGYDKKYELNVSTFQMIILLLFNEKESLSYGDILQQTKIPMNELKRNIMALTVKTATHQKLLTNSSDKTLTKDSVFTVNNDFESKLIKVKISPVVVKETKEQQEETKQKVDEERKWMLDAAIVRIMKARKTLEHRDLVIEVTKQLQQRFMPSPDMIKKRIESLIEREYLERSTESRSKYNYVA